MKFEDIYHQDGLEVTLFDKVRLKDGKHYYLFNVNGKTLIDLGFIIQPANEDYETAKQKAQEFLDEAIRLTRIEMSDLKVETSFTVIDKGGKYEHRF